MLIYYWCVINQSGITGSQGVKSRLMGRIDFLSNSLFCISNLRARDVCLGHMLEMLKPREEGIDLASN